jgi:hypothetical protein
MTTPDIINGAVEFAGSLAAWANVRTLWKDKGYAGISVAVMGFFAARSLWRGYFYLHLGQTGSMVGGASNAFAYCLFVILMIHFGKKR